MLFVEGCQRHRRRGRPNIVDHLDDPVAHLETEPRYSLLDCARVISGSEVHFVEEIGCRYERCQVRHPGRFGSELNGRCVAVVGEE